MTKESKKTILQALELDKKLTEFQVRKEGLIEQKLALDPIEQAIEEVKNS